MKNASPIFLLLAFTGLLSYCAEQVDSTDIQTEGPYFPRQVATEGETEQMEALLIGELVYQNNCFRIKSENSSTVYTPIWPANFDYQLTTDSVFVILNAAGNEVARTNAGIRLSGGEINHAELLEGRIEGGVPKLLLSCPVPYWIVGDEVGVVNTSSGLATEVKLKLQAWLDFYAAHIEDWRFDAFSLSDQWQIDSLLQVPTSNIYPIADRPEAWLHQDPSGRFNLDIYARDIMIDRKNDGQQVVYALSPDSEVALENPDLETRQRLLFCGTPCRFEAALWEDEQTVVIAGLHQSEEQLFHPTLWRIKLNDLSVQEYTYPTPLPDPFPFNYVQEIVFGGL